MGRPRHQTMSPRREKCFNCDGGAGDLLKGMADESPPRDRRMLVWLAGATALAAWFALLWLMFGDVL
jgi:hypothetical protein